MIHLCDKRFPDALSSFGNILVVIEVNFFFLESSDESFSIPILPRTPSPGYGNLNVMIPERRDVGV